MIKYRDEKNRNLQPEWVNVNLEHNFRSRLQIDCGMLQIRPVPLHIGRVGHYYFALGMSIMCMISAAEEPFPAGT